MGVRIVNNRAAALVKHQLNNNYYCKQSRLLHIFYISFTCYLLYASSLGLQQSVFRLSVYSLCLFKQNFFPIFPDKFSFNLKIFL
jgi:hypothetical protein